MMKLLRMLAWSVRLDFEFLFGVRGLPAGGKLLFILQKYLRFLAGTLLPSGSSPKSLLLFGKTFCYNEPLAVASLQRVYCAHHALKEILPLQPTVVDVGANIGQFNFFAQQYLGARRVVSFEPGRESYQALQKSAANPDDCLCCAVSDREGEVVFHVARESTQLSSYLPDPDLGYSDSYAVRARTLDNAAGELGVGEVDLLKVDTEGSELDVLRSATGLLARTALVLVEMSVFRSCSGNLFQIGTFLEEQGFELVELSGCWEGKHPSDLDALFRKR